MLNNTRQVRMTTATTTPRRAGYELLLKRNHHRSEHHYCSSEVEVSDAMNYLIWNRQLSDSMFINIFLSVLILLTLVKPLSQPILHIPSYYMLNIDEMSDIGDFDERRIT